MNKDTSQQIKIIAFPGAPNLPLFAAIAQGFFKSEGLNVILETTPSSVKQIQQFHSGAYDIAFTAFDNIVAYHEGQGAVQLEGGCDFKVIMGATQIELSAIFNSSIHSGADIKGKSLALDAVGTG
ncbi:MAG: ABC transporter substrate-binding protein, partial [Betaproteobacteria bacterium]|nr:ABC transporter substrate-binding protein [Betaproteobacteria bacterium]